MFIARESLPTVMTTQVTTTAIHC